MEEVKQVVDEVSKACSYDNTIVKLTMEFREKIKEYESYNWMVKTFRSNILKEQDWVEINKLLKNDINTLNLLKFALERALPDISSKPDFFTLNQSLNFSLKQLKDLGINKYCLEMETIKSKATRRANFIKELKVIVDEFNSIRLQTVPKNESNSIKGINDIQEKLDEHASKIQNIYSNPVTQSDLKFKQEARLFDTKLKHVQAVLEQIVLFQSSFFYLQPIFSGVEIKALSEEKKLFDKVQKYWNEGIMDSINDNEIPLCELYEKDPNLYKLLCENNIVLKTIKKSLEEYLNGKRKLFPRFYFVSDEDLMKILAQSKDPTLIQPHLIKCFEGIYNVVFENESVILAMRNVDGELVPLKNSIDVNEGKYKTLF